MKTVTSVSGGRTSAYLAANYPADHLVFSLVRIEDEGCRFKDEKLRLLVEDRLQVPFIGTAEDDMIINTLFDLEQYLGRYVQWVTGPTYDSVIKKAGGWLPNKLHRFCTTAMKIEPIFYWWAATIGRDNPVIMNIGYRASETGRANRMNKQVNREGLLELKATFGTWPDGRNKWEFIPWQRPAFPLISDNIHNDTIKGFWQGKPVRFAEYNNCVGCFHRNPYFLRYMFDCHPEKMNWFKNQEGGKNGYWKNGVSYAFIEKMLPARQLFGDQFGGCDDGFCEA